MSFGIDFAQVARSQFQRLEPWLQEKVLDLIDAVASDPAKGLRHVGVQREEVIDLKAGRNFGCGWVTDLKIVDAK